MINQYSVNEKITTKCLEYKTRFLEKKIRLEDKISKYFYHMYNAEANNLLFAVRERIRVYEEIRIYMYLQKYNLFVVILYPLF